MNTKPRTKDEYLAASIKHIQSRLGTDVIEIPEEIVAHKYILRDLIRSLQEASVYDFPVADYLMQVIQLKEDTNGQN